ncbi:Hypothetical protein PHPALM_8231, partial [Phytophthora palmivora]
MEVYNQVEESDIPSEVEVQLRTEEGDGVSAAVAPDDELTNEWSDKTTDTAQVLKVRSAEKQQHLELKRKRVERAKTKVIDSATERDVTSIAAELDTEQRERRRRQAAGAREQAEERRRKAGRESIKKSIKKSRGNACVRLVQHPDTADNSDIVQALEAIADDGLPTAAMKVDGMWRAVKLDTCA